MTLIAAWIHVRTELDGLTLSEAWRQLCTAADYKSGGLSRLYQFRDGKRTPPPRLIRLMQRDVLPRLPAMIGPMTRHTREWADALSPPDRAAENQRD